MGRQRQPHEISIVQPEDWGVPEHLRDHGEGRVLYRCSACGALWYQDRGDAPGEHGKVIGRYKGLGFEL